MDINYWAVIGVALILSMGSLIGLFYVVRNLLGKEQGYKYEDEIEDALRPFVVKAIQAAYKTSELILEEVEETLDGMNKAEIAKKLYSYLPNEIILKSGKVVDIQFVKKIVPLERWEQMIQNAFDAGVSWTDSFQDKLVEQALKLIEEVK